MIKEKRLLELDSLRGIAALGVCFLHYGFFKYGCTGVDLFFMISGFVIYMSVSNAKNIKGFFVLRAIRLYPAYWLAIVIAIIIEKYTGIFDIPAFKWNFVIGNLTMLQPLFRAQDIISVFWTLYIEINFYLLIAALWYFNQLKNIENIILIGMLLITAAIMPYQYLNINAAWYNRYFVITRGLLPIINHFHLFAAGIVFYTIYTKGINLWRTLLLLLSFILVYVTHPVGGRVFYWLNVYQHLFCCLCFYITFFIVIYHKAYFLRFKFLYLLGIISYPFYLVHTFFIGIKIDSLSTFGPATKLIGVAAALTLAYVITYYFDIPLRQWLKRN